MKRRLVFAALMLSLACSERVPSPGSDPLPVPVLESNIIFNGNLSLYSFNRWPEDEAENNSKRRAIISHIQDLQGIGSREAIWTSYGSVEMISYGESFDFSYNDKVFRELEAAGLGYCLQMKLDAVVVNPDNYGPQWEKNARWYVKMLGLRYGSKPLYYIPMNEPDNEGQRPSGVAALTKDEILKVQKLVWETLKDIDPDIKIASSPLCSLADNTTYTTSGRQVLLGGITQWCDYFAFHKHVDIGEDGNGSETVLWSLMDEAEKAGYPRKSALVNENGTSLTLKLVWPEASEEQCRQFKAYWVGNDLVQMKSLGLKYIVMYSLAGSLGRDGEFNIVDLDTPEGNAYKVHTLEYNAYKDLWNPRAHSLALGINGGFEQANPDKSRGWTVAFRGRSFNNLYRVEPKEWDYVDIVDQGAYQGSCCLEMRPIDFTPTASIDGNGITANRCRRLVEGLCPGRKYSLSAYFKLRSDGQEDHPEVSLRALGWSSLGYSSSASSDVISPEYAKLEVSFVADNPWVVISLEHNGSGYALWDAVELTDRGL